MQNQNLLIQQLLRQGVNVVLARVSESVWDKLDTLGLPYTRTIENFHTMTAQKKMLFAKNSPQLQPRLSPNNRQ